MRTIRRGYVRRIEKVGYNHATGLVAPAPAPAPDEATPEGLLERTYAWRQANIVSEFLVPFLLSSVFSVLTGIGIALLLENSLYSYGSAIAVCLVALLLIVRHQFRSMWVIEQYGEEITEGASGTSAIRVEVVEGSKTRFMDIEGLTEKKLYRVATHCLANGKRFSRRSLRGILTQGEYESLYSAMLKAGLLREAKNGCELTGSGRAMLSKYV